MGGSAATTSSPTMADGDGEAYISLGMVAKITRDAGANEIASEIGGMISSLIHILIVTPVIFLWLRGLTFKRGHCMNPSGVRAH
jgi:hypothetical protein